MPLIKGKQLADDTIQSSKIDETGTLSTINAGDSAVTGSATGIARKDHQHAVATGGTTASIDIGDSAAEGSSSNLAREDHQHALAEPSAPVNVTKAAAAAGVATTVARADHKHDVTTAAAVELTDSTNAEGDSTSLARANHTHSHGSRGGGSLHAAATGSVAGFMTAADKTKLDLLVDPKLVSPKDSVRLLSTTNIATLSGNQTVDGVLTAPGERVALFGQTTTTQDGIYVTASGAWTRADDFAVGSAQAGAVFAVEEGTANGDEFWMVTNNAGSDVVGTDDLVAEQTGAGTPRGAGAGLVLNGNDLDVTANADGSITVNADDIQVGVINDTQHGTRGGGTLHADVIAGGADGFMTGADKTKLDGITAGATPNKTSNDEVLASQAITGTDTALTAQLTNTPDPAASVRLYLNGVKQQRGATKDYTISGKVVTWLASTGTAVDMDTGDVVEVSYLS